MEAAVDLAAALAAMPGATPIPGIADAWHWALAPGLDFAAATSSDGKHAFQLFARLSYDEELVTAVFGFAREHTGELLAAFDRPLAVAEGFRHPDPAFDLVVAVNPALHRYHAEENPELGARTLAVFPAYRCEFAGDEDETDAQYRYARAAGVPASTLRREPRPYLKMRSRTESGRVIAKRGFAGVKLALVELRSLEGGAPERFVELENYRHEVRRFEWADGQWTVGGGETPEHLDAAGVREFLRTFLWGPDIAAGTTELPE
jgi:hypothetical protein